jgi:DNA-binding response OmpR family regulator
MLEFKNLTMNDDLKLCFIDNKPLKLTKSEYDVLFFLLNNKDKVFSRSQLQEVISGRKISTRSVDSAISRMRKKLGNFGDNLETRVGYGYCFNTKNYEQRKDSE